MTLATDPMVLEAPGVRAVVLPADGGRLGSLIIDGRELLVTRRPEGPISWGSYPMAPWAGRIRHGELAFSGREYRLPLGMPPHAIHGVVYDRPWQVVAPGTISIELDERWPFRGRVSQRFALDADGLEITMTLAADEPMPAVIGWHPWFRRVLAEGDAPLVLSFRADEMLVRDAEGIPIRGARGASARTLGRCLHRHPGAAGARVAGPPAAGDLVHVSLAGRVHDAREHDLRGAPERTAGRAEPGTGGRGARRAADPHHALELDERVGGPAGTGACPYRPGSSSGGTR